MGNCSLIEKQPGLLHLEIGIVSSLSCPMVVVCFCLPTALFKLYGRGQNILPLCHVAMSVDPSGHTRVTAPVSPVVVFVEKSLISVFKWIY